ncbi:MAG: hypothetical protein ACTSPB_01435 [Candidatus Thorarchaeota archaeon]
MTKKRKPPKRHTVQTKHPRYNLPEYLRGRGGQGSCGGTPLRDGSGGGVGNIVNPKKTSESRSPNYDVIRDIYALSSGTMATITGKRKYTEINEEINKFAKFVEKSFIKFDSWQDAWDWYSRPRSNKRLQKSIQTPDKIKKKKKIYTWAGSNYGYDNKEVAKKMAKSDRRVGKKSIIRTITGTNPPYKGKKWYVVYSRHTPKSIKRLYSDERVQRERIAWMKKEGLV